MARYYFETYDGRSTIKDTDGLALGSLGEARTHALQALGDMARDALRNGPVREIEVRVREDRKLCLALTLTLKTRDYA